MAREMIVRCDGAFTARVKDCGEEHDDTRTFTIKVDGEAWEVDLGGPHAEALLQLARRGRALATEGRGADLNRRIRNAPALG